MLTAERQPFCLSLKISKHFPVSSVLYKPGVGVTKPIFSVLLFSHFSRMIKTVSGYLYDIKFIFGRCHRSWAAATPGKYEHDWKYLKYTFAKSKISRNGEINERSFSNPHPCPLWGHVLLRSNPLKPSDTSMRWQTTSIELYKGWFR